VPRRIELPSADDLFGEVGDINGSAAPRNEPARGAPPAQSGTPLPPQARRRPPSTSRRTASPRTPALTSSTSTGAASEATAPAPPRRRAAGSRSSANGGRSTGRSPKLLARLDALESRLGDMPIDALLALRADLEELLEAPEIPRSGCSTARKRAGRVRAAARPYMLTPRMPEPVVTPC